MNDQTKIDELGFSRPADFKDFPTAVVLSRMEEQFNKDGISIGWKEANGRTGHMAVWEAVKEIENLKKQFDDAQWKKKIIEPHIFQLRAKRPNAPDIRLTLLASDER